MRCPLCREEIFFVAGPGASFRLVAIEDAQPGDFARRCTCGHHWALRVARS